MSDSGEAPVELELKLALPDADALERLAAVAVERGAARRPTVVQENHIFDTEAWDLNASDCVLRLRRTVSPDGVAFRATAKGRLRGVEQEELHARAEEEAGLDAERAQAVLDGSEDLAAALRAELGRASALLDEIERVAGSSAVREIGCFTNHRTVIGPLEVDGAAVALELDRTELPDGSEAYEVELELPPTAVEAGRALLHDLLDAARVEGRPAGSKSGRFLEAVRRRAERGG